MTKTLVLPLLAAAALLAQPPQPGQPAASEPGMQTGAEPGASPAPSFQPSVSSTAPGEMSLGDFQGSVPHGTATANPIPLTLSDAIRRGLLYNLGLLTSEQASQQSRAERYRALSALLPSIGGQLSMTEQQQNLQALGFLVTPPPSSGFTIPKIVGPYSYQSVLATAKVPLFNFSSIEKYKASQQDLKASALAVKNARDLVVLAVGNAYLRIIADNAGVSATKAEIAADQAIYNNAQARHQAGVAIAIDVLRSEVELKRRQQQLVATQNQFDKDKLTLGRIIGLPLGQDFNLANPSLSVPAMTISLQQALGQAYANRPDYRAAEAQVTAAKYSLRAAKAERYPTLTASGNYGDVGLRVLNNSHGVFQATGSINFPIFDGHRIKADILQSSTELQNRRNDLANLRGQIDYEVRTALLDLQSAKDQVSVAQSNVGLANKTLQQSRDRFTAGVTNTVEVVQAQQTVADASESLISAQYQYNVAKVELARALGVADQSMSKYFKAQH
ncbi:MAG TPA: TolC family protein [Bryobacteraceae bacterium]